MFRRTPIRISAPPPPEPKAATKPAEDLADWLPASPPYPEPMPEPEQAPPVAEEPAPAPEPRKRPARQRKITLRPVVEEKPLPQPPAPANGLPPFFTTSTGELYMVNPMSPDIYAKYETIEAYNNREALPVYVSADALTAGPVQVVGINWETLNISILQ